MTINLACFYQKDRIIAVTQNDKVFTVHSDTRTYTGSNLLIATGVGDDWDSIPNAKKYAGHFLFWSVELNGKVAHNKPAAVIGHDDLAIQEALRLKMFTNQVALITHGYELTCSEPGKMLRILTAYKIPVYDQPIQCFMDNEHTLNGVLLKDDVEIPAEILFSPSQFQIPHNELAINLGVHVDSRGYIKVNNRFETNIDNVYAPEDVATQTSHKSVLIAFYQGMEVAWVLHEKLFKETIQAALEEHNLPHPQLNGV